MASDLRLLALIVQLIVDRLEADPGVTLTFAAEAELLRQWMNKNANPPEREEQPDTESTSSQATDQQVIDRLLDAGWSREDAEDWVKRELYPVEDGDSTRSGGR